MAPRLNPYERFTFRNLAQSLGAGLDPAFAQSVMDSTYATAQQRALQRQEVMLGLQQMAYQQAAAGIPEEATSWLLDAMGASYPFLNRPRYGGVLEETMGGLYPEQPDFVRNPDIPDLGTTTPSEVRYGLPPSQAPVQLTAPNPDAGLSPLYTAPRDARLAEEARASQAEIDQQLQIAQGQAQIGLDTQLQGALQEAALPGMIGTQPLSEEERMSIGQLVSQRMNQGRSYAEIQQEVQAVTLGMDSERAQEAMQFATQAWQQVSGAKPGELNQVAKQVQAALNASGNMEVAPGITATDVANRMATTIVSNPELKPALPQILQFLVNGEIEAVVQILQQFGYQKYPGADGK